MTTGIVLSRINYGEADRIVTFITSDQGKVRLFARGGRKIKSKLAGGIELFSVSDISFVRGRGEIGTLTSSRLKQHYGLIVQNIDRTMLGYEATKMINRITEDRVDKDYYDLLGFVLDSLNCLEIDKELIRLWFNMQLLKLGGHSPNLRTDKNGSALSQDQIYRCDPVDMTFVKHTNGMYDSRHIKLLRLAIGLDSPRRLANVDNITNILPACLNLSRGMLQQFVYHY